MRTLITASIIAALLVALAIASGCEDSPVKIGKDFEMVLLANHSTVRIVPGEPDPTSTLVATIVSDTGVPQPDVLVFFSSTGGDLASNTQAVSTDGNGNAFDTLTVSALDPAEISVTATATTLMQTVKVTKTAVDACLANTAPTASFLVSNPDPGTVGTSRAVSPTDTSGDAAPGIITSWAWDCGNGTSGGTTSTPTCNYVVGTATKIYTITLTVKDDGLGGGAPYTCQKTSTATRPVTIALEATP